MENIKELVRERRSVRTFDGKGIRPEDREKLTAFGESIKNPYDIPVTFKFLDAKVQPLKCPVVTGTDLFIGMKVPYVAHMEEAVGYSFEALVLYAQSLGMGTVWVGGTMDRAAFEKAMELSAEEKMPCMSPIGYPAKKMAVKESIMRKAVKADSRAAFNTLFFDGDFSTPLTEEKAGSLAEPLEAVRWAPSAVNKQPWRAILKEGNVHFYIKHAKGYKSDAVGDMQKVDMGIALCHFDLAAKEAGLKLQFALEDPGVTIEADMEYIASFIAAE